MTEAEKRAVAEAKREQTRFVWDMGNGTRFVLRVGKPPKRKPTSK